MTAYRDQYASLFNDGQNVVVLGISNDPPAELHSWLKDLDFPFVFTSDAENNGGTYAAFGGNVRENGFVEGRSVIVVGPDGRIAGVIPQFNQVDPQAYDELAAIVDEVTPAPDVEGGA
jgi:peroxiredoxin